MKLETAIASVAIGGAVAIGWGDRANAAVIRINESAFTPQAGLITFSEFALNTFNPTYTPATYGGGPGAPTVTFGGFFTGQSLGDASTCPPGAALTGCVIGTPRGPLALDPTSPNTFITEDGSNPTSPVLSGSPIFDGPVSILFDTDLAGVGLEGGFFDDIGSTAITAFARDGSVLGSVTNTTTGIEFLGLVTDDGQNKIAGLQFSLVGNESAGFAIDNLRFGRAGQVEPPTGIPEPTTILGTLAFGALGGNTWLKRRRKQQR
jgi:hypothetical protein